MELKADLFRPGPKKLEEIAEHNVDTLKEREFFAMLETGFPERKSKQSTDEVRIGTLRNTEPPADHLFICCIRRATTRRRRRRSRRNESLSSVPRRMHSPGFSTPLLMVRNYRV